MRDGVPPPRVERCLFMKEERDICVFSKEGCDRHCANICYCIRVLEEKASRLG